MGHGSAVVWGRTGGGSITLDTSIIIIIIITTTTTTIIIIIIVITSSISSTRRSTHYGTSVRGKAEHQSRQCVHQCQLEQRLR